MDLKDFISQTMIEIMQGIRESQRSARDKYVAQVNPLMDKGDIPIGSRTDMAAPAMGQKGYAPHTLFIEFDVAIVASNDEKDKAGFKLSVAGFGAHIKKESANTNSTHNRIKFTLPLSLRADTEYFEKLKEADTK